MLKGFYLSLLMGPIVTSAVPREVIEALATAQVTQTAGSRAGFQLVLNVARRGSIVTSLLPSGFFDPLTRVQIVVTVNGQPNILMDGVVSRCEMSASNDPGMSTLTVTGEDISLAMDQLDFTGFPYPCMPFEARVAVCLAKYAMYGIIPIIIPSAFIDVPNPLETLPSHAGTDLAYIQFMANEVGYNFYVTPGPTLGTNYAYWGPEIRWGQVQPALTVNMDAQTNVESMSFTYDPLTAKLYTMMVHIPETTISIPVPLPSVGLLRPPLAGKQPFPLKLEPLDEGINKYPLPRALAVGLSRAAQGNDVVTGTGSLNVVRYGRVLSARSLVDVRGGGRTFDGTYYVKSVTHNLKRGEYKQSFSLAREGTTPIGSTVRT
ncbi:MAG TPA: hypothetical protein VN947_03375 [Polyangia bacterium]|nr:hypothetical protein [Polyangia bacterium]